MLMKPSVPNRRSASKIYAALTCAAGARTADPALPMAAAQQWRLQSVNPEIGSLPINALAIALALTAETVEA